MKGKHDNTFTESVLQRLFCNIEAILDLHRRLLAELKACVKGGVSYRSPVAGVYLKFVSYLIIFPVSLGNAGRAFTLGSSYRQNVFSPTAEGGLLDLPGVWEEERGSSEAAL